MPVGFCCAALRSRDREAAAMKASLEPEEAELASADAELKIIAGLGRTAQREAAATAQIAETRAVIAEQKTLIERLTGCASRRAGWLGTSIASLSSSSVKAAPGVGLPGMCAANALARAIAAQIKIRRGEQAGTHWPHAQVLAIALYACVY
mgnify:CR=1 FL=1